LGGGLVLTAVGTYGGLGMIQNNPALAMPTFIGAMIASLILFFVARGIAENANNTLALPLLALYSLLTGYTLSGIVYVALGTQETSCKSVLTVNMKNKFHSRKFVSTVKNGLKLIENHLLK
jgi:FtsH-binding integral membrane protein